jgi:hypothetical protein
MPTKQEKILFPVHFTLFLLFVTFSIFFVRGLLFLDPDFGWRLRTGEMILHEGVPRTDPFSYSMPSFPWVDHAWLSSVIISLVYSLFGKIGLTLVFSVIAFCALFISLSESKPTVGKKVFTTINDCFATDIGVFGNFLFWLAFSVLFAFFGVRVQVISWLMLAILLKLILDLTVWAKYKFMLPFFFALWANLHGSFALGLLVLILVIVTRALQERKLNFVNLIIFLGSALATLINPYTVHIWREVWSSVSDVQLRWTVQEWMPTLTMFNLPVILFFASAITFVMKQKGNLLPEELVVFLVFFVQAISSRRHLPLFVIAVSPIVTRAVCHLGSDLQKLKNGFSRLKKVYRVYFFFTLMAVFLQGVVNFRVAFSLREASFYPKQAVAFLHRNLPAGQIFSRYGWGGYLIWKLPEKKVFVDGRMPSWRWDGNPSDESDSAFDEYNDILQKKKKARAVFENYNIDTVLWPAKKEPKRSGFVQKVLNVFRPWIGLREKGSFTSNLESSGWKKKYEDEVAVIYSRSI